MKKINNMFVFLLMVLWVDIILAHESLRGAISNSIIIGINNIDNKNTGIDHSDENVDDSIHRELLLTSAPKLDLPLLGSKFNSYHKNDDSSNKVNDEGQKRNPPYYYGNSKGNESSSLSRPFHSYNDWRNRSRSRSRSPSKSSKSNKGNKTYYGGKKGKSGNTNTDGVETNSSDNGPVGIEDSYNSNSSYNEKKRLTAPILATMVVASAFIVLILLMGVSRRRRQNQHRKEEKEEYLREVAGATDTHQDANSLEYAIVVSHHLDLSDSDSCDDSRQQSNICPLSSLDELARSYRSRDTVNL